MYYTLKLVKLQILEQYFQCWCYSYPTSTCLTAKVTSVLTYLIKGDTEYLGVTFIDGEKVVFDKEIMASALPLYEEIDYSGLTEGTKFMIMEGGNIVGEGTVNEVFQHISAKEFRK